MPSQAAIARMRTDRDTAMMSTRRARADKRAAEAKVKDVKKEKREALKKQAKQFAMLLLMSSLSLGAGLVIGGQLTRIKDPDSKKGEPNKYVGWAQWGALLLGLLTLAYATKGWHTVVGFILLGVGGVKVADFSRQLDLIPGTYDWEEQIPEGPTVVKVVSAS